MNASSGGLVARFNARDERALARGISLLEAGDVAGAALLKAVRARRKGRQGRGGAHIVGVTGSPGSGKSTLTDALITEARAVGKTVAVLAVDPTSPYSGGAILGDRVRMMRHHQDADVFIRSVATRGHLGGLSATTLQVTALLDAYGFDLILLETVGVGQSEIDVVRVADTTLLLLTPGQGDGVQAFKAGIMEIADVFVINKADQPGSGRLRREIKAALELAPYNEELWRPLILETVASTGSGVPELLAALSTHRAALEQSGGLETVQRQRARLEISTLLADQVRRRLEELGTARLEAVLRGETSAAEVAAELLGERPARVTHAVYPGSFDPLHHGHLDIIRRSRHFCDHLTVAVLGNSLKSSKLLEPEVRAEIIRAATADLDNVKVETFSGLLTDYVRRSGAQLIVKSLRGALDLEYEAQMAQLNRLLYPDAETIFLLASPEWSFVSSTRVRELFGLGADISRFVPKATLETLAKLE